LPVVSLDHVDRLERLTDLVLVLLHAGSPKTLDDIARSVPGYPDNHSARRQAFERDKRILRDEGIPVVTEPVDGPEQFGYRIDAASLYLPDLALGPDEEGALQLAVAAVNLGDPAGRDALAKLGTVGVAQSRVVASLAPPGALAPIFDAVRTRSEVRFGYRGEERTVAPAAVRFRAGRWYLVGWDRGRDAARTFRVDRVEGPAVVGPAGGGAPPEGFDLDAAPIEPWRAAEGAEDEHILVRVDPVEAPRVVAEVGAHALAERLGDGSVVVRLGVTTFELLRSWVLGLLDHAEVVGPPWAREAMAAWLDTVSAPTPPGAGDDEGDDVGAGDVTRPAPRGQESKVASTRLRRMLAMVAWLADVGEAAITDVAARFGLSVDEVVHELELAACCGVPPYTPDTLLEIVVSDDVVQAFLPKELARPRRLTPQEGLALAAAARTLLAVPGSDQRGALGRALAKLEAVLGDHRGLVIDIDAPPRLDDVRRALDAGLQAEIDYHSASTDETTVRVVEPLSVVSIDGHWYLDAWCRRADGLRRFRVDRIRALRLLDDAVTGRGRDALQIVDAFVPGEGTEEVTLVLDPPARWVADTIPVLERHDRSDGRLAVTLPVGGRAWLERLLLQAGPHARVVGPPALADVGRTAAARLRHLYG
jgi:predicted DNA-binding transcriptional regulator YafY